MRNLLLAVFLALLVATGGACKPVEAATYAKVARYTRCPVGGQLVIQPMGDSITAGLVTGGGWRSLLLAKIAAFRGGAVGPAGVVDSWGDLNNTLYGYDASTGSQHSGHPGSSAQQWVDNGWMATFNPVPGGISDVHFGLIMLGANDVGDPPTNSAADYVLTLVDQFLVLHPQAIVFVSNRLPRSFAGTSNFNAILAAGVAAKRAAGKNVVLVDNYAVIQMGDLYDGLHPAAGGMAKIADQWFIQMTPYLRR